MLYEITRKIILIIYIVFIYLLLEDMDKLIELVYYYNSHLDKGKIGIGLTTSVKENGREVPFDKDKEIRKYENYIISKKYGFIERLVENDKIDESKIFCDQGLYYSLLCKLAISDTPIEDLISYLK